MHWWAASRIKRLYFLRPVKAERIQRQEAGNLPAARVKQHRADFAQAGVLEELLILAFAQGQHLDFVAVLREGLRRLVLRAIKNKPPRHSPQQVD